MSSGEKSIRFGGRYGSANADIDSSDSVRPIDFGPYTSHVLGVLCDASYGDIVVICAEPGMGKTALLSKCLAFHQRNGARMRLEDFSCMSSNEVVEKMSETARWARINSNKGHSVVIGFDNLPSADEYQVDVYIRLLRRMAAAGSLVLLSLMPECALLCERLGESVCYWSCDLCLPVARGEDHYGLLYRYTHGIPMLMNAVNRVYDPQPSTIMSDPIYQEAFVTLVSKSIRDSLIYDERQLRTALLLMGSGTRWEVTALLGELDEGIWRLLARDAPLFGLDTIHDRFECVGTYSVDGLNAAFPVLRDVARDYPEMVLSIVRLLASRGHHARAASVAGMCSSFVDRATMVFEWAYEFVNAGEVGMVLDTVNKAKQEGLVALHGFDEASMLTGVVAAKFGRKLTISRQSQYETTRQGRYVNLIAEAVDVLRGEDSVAFRQDTGVDGENLELLKLHVSALKSMAQGRYNDAYMRLLDMPQRQDATSFVSALLATDYVACSLLCGITPLRVDIEAVECARQFFDEAGLAPFASMCDAVMPCAVVLAGRQVPPITFETHIRRAELLGLKLLKGTYLAAAAVADLKSGAFMRAHVRLRQAIDCLDETHNAVLRSSYILIDIATRIQLGEHVAKAEFYACRGRSESLDHMVQVLLVASGTIKVKRGVGVGRWGAEPFSHDLYWLVNILSYDCGSFSRKVYDALPDLWKTMVRHQSSEIDGLFEKAVAPHEQALDVAPSVVESSVAVVAKEPVPPIVRISVLGSLEVRVCGELVQGSRLERRRAKSLLALLAATRGHAVKRYTIMESVWPEHDYQTANKCIYSATSVLRTELGLVDEEGKAIEIVLSNKAESTLRLNTRYVRCDIDEFEQKARQIIDAGEADDRASLALAREVEELYEGNLYVPPCDGMGIVAARSNELAERFADAMIAGAKAAMRCGHMMRACRLARKACDVDGYREDAMEVLMEALCAAGRRVEAERHYESFALRVIDISKKPPSRHLREKAHDLLGLPARQSTLAAPATSAESNGHGLGRDGDNEYDGEQLVLDLTGS